MQGKTQNIENFEANKVIQWVQKNKKEKSPKLLSIFTYLILMAAYLQILILIMFTC